MSWRSILGKIMTIAKAKLNAALKKFDDPEARLDLAVEEYEEVIVLLKRAMVLMGAKKKQIGNFKMKTEKNIMAAKNRARNHREKGTPRGERLARIHLTTVAYGETAIIHWSQVEKKLEEDIISIQEDVVLADETIVALKMRIGIDKMRMEVAEAQIGAYEQVTGLRSRGNSLAEALSDYEEAVEDKESTAQAFREMIAEGMITTVTQEVLEEPEYGRVDELLKELDAEIHIVQTTELEPDEERNLFVSPPLTKLKTKQEAR